MVMNGGSFWGLLLFFLKFLRFFFGKRCEKDENVVKVVGVVVVGGIVWSLFRFIIGIGKL